MLAADDPVGPKNDRAFRYWRKRVEMIVAAWGANCPASREQAVCAEIGRTIHCLGRTKAGRPKHPLYLRAETQPEVFWMPGSFAQPIHMRPGGGVIEANR